VRYEGAVPLKSFKIYRSDDQRLPLVEVLSKEHVIAVPPSEHAKTRRPYVWWNFGLGSAYPPLKAITPLKDLPVVTDADLEELRRVVSPWAAAPREERKFEARKGGASPAEAEANRHRYGPYAARALKGEAANVATLQKGSRNRGLFDAVCRIGWAVHHGVITEADLADAFMDACKQNGLLADDGGRRGVEETIRSGLQAAQKDPLPELKDRPFDKRPNAAPAANEAVDAVTRSFHPSHPDEAQPSESIDNDAAEVEHLARLKPIEYERVRKEEAERLGIKRVSVLDAAVKQARAQYAAANAAPEIGGETPEPWPDSVDGGGLLAEIVAALRSHVILPEDAYLAVALWILHAHAHDAAAISPILAIISPEKRCGKTTLLSLLQELTPNPILAANITAAAVFRAVEVWRPTLLVDVFRRGIRTPLAG
jgi:hypothetical protein